MSTRRAGHLTAIEYSALLAAMALAEVEWDQDGDYQRRVALERAGRKLWLWHSEVPLPKAK